MECSALQIASSQYFNVKNLICHNVVNKLSLSQRELQWLVVDLSQIQSDSHFSYNISRPHLNSWFTKYCSLARNCKIEAHKIFLMKPYTSNQGG